MTKEIQFLPGRFQPVVEIAQRDTGLPSPADTDFTGLEEVALATLEVARAASRGSGAIVDSEVPRSRLAKIVRALLCARNSAEQLAHVGVFTRYNTPLRSPGLTFLEPVVRAYNYYGHFEHDGKVFVTRGLEKFLIQSLFLLKSEMTVGVADGTANTVAVTDKVFKDIDPDYYHLTPEGEIAFGKRMPLKHYILEVVRAIYDLDSLEPDSKLPWIRSALDISTEASLVHFLRSARVIPGWTTPDRDSLEDAPDAHKAAMKKLFGNEYSSPGDLIPLSRLTGSITLAYNLLRRLSTEHGYAMKTIQLPKYEGGSAAQLAAYTDDVLTSQVPLSLSDSTAALAFTTSYGVSRLFRSAPALEREMLVRDLVAQSLLPLR
uniref:Coat protein n=1 Tax=Beauveria bassiana partitivirus 5 TaxID=3071798 RepID=A0AA51HK09_9VIRU|nr:coat protein [Beauveria bassiana partitivirus 5]